MFLIWERHFIYGNTEDFSMIHAKLAMQMHQERRSKRKLQHQLTHGNLFIELGIVRYEDVNVY